MTEYIYHDNGYGTTYKFEVVDKIPRGYDIWNIPDCLGGYMPLCKCYEGTYTVMQDCLKAIKVESAEERRTLFRGAFRGSANLQGARRVLADKRVRRDAKERAEKSLPILERLTEGE